MAITGPRDRMNHDHQALTIDVDEERQVSGLLMLPPRPLALYVLAHGAGAGMAHPFMTDMAGALMERNIGTLRYQFHYMERGSRRPDAPRLAHAAVRAAAVEAARQAPGVPLIAGGKSFGGRMTSQAQAIQPLPDVRGLAFLGFPLHPPGKPGDERGDHLAEIDIPMLFIQGTRDEFAKLELLEPVCERLGNLATLDLVEGGNHSFRVPKAAGRKPAEVLADLADKLAAWLEPIAAH